jgi:uncharacterized protein (DUF4415 family)
MGMVKYSMENLPKVSKEEWDRVDAIKDEEIDYSDIPEVKDFSGFLPFADRKMYRPVKVAVTCKLDADIVAWLKQGGKGYQTRLNAILRQVMVQTM